MLFNSLDFAFFLPLVFSLYWLFYKSIKIQNIILVLASYYFYSCWDWRFLSLIVISTIVDYIVGLALSHEDSHKKRKALLWLSVIVNLGFLGFFKYYNFFIEQFQSNKLKVNQRIEGKTMLILASIYDNPEMIRFLIQNGARKESLYHLQYGASSQHIKFEEKPQFLSNDEVEEMLLELWNAYKDGRLTHID